MKRLTALLMLVTACSTTAGGLNVYESSGLDEAISLEIIDDREDGSQRWMTVSEDAQVRKLAALLDMSLEEDAGDRCDTTVVVNFYSADASNQQLEVGCDRIRLMRAAGEATYSAPEFSSAIADLLATLPSP